MAVPELCDALIIGNKDPEIASRYERPIVIRFRNEPAVSKALRSYHVTDQLDLNHAVYAEFGNHAHVIQISRVPIIDNTDESDLWGPYVSGVREMVSMLGNCPIDALQGVVHAIKNAHLAGAPSIGTMTVGDLPVLSIGSGPGLRHYINQIRDIQDHVLIVASDSAMIGLVEAGIRPDLCTPLERVPQVIPHLRCNHSSVYAGTVSVHPEAVNGFKQHLFVPTTDFINTWMRPHAGSRFNQGSSTGVLSALVGRVLSQGKLYLIGHDLCMEGENSHWEGAKIAGQFQREYGTHEIHTRVMCYDGVERDTIQTYDRLRRELSVYLGHDEANTCVINPKNAYIPGIPRGTLPYKIKGQKKHLNWGAPRDEKSYECFMQRVERLPSDTATLREALLSAQRDEDMAIFKALPDSPNANILGLICKSLFASHLIEHGITKRSAMNPLKESLSNLFDIAIPMIEEACDVAVGMRC